MKLALTGNEWAQVVLALANVVANRSYNTLQAVLMGAGYERLSDEAVDHIGKTNTLEMSLDTQGNTSWQVIIDALAELPIKQVGALYTKITQAVSAGSLTGAT